MFIFFNLECFNPVMDSKMEGLINKFIWLRCQILGRPHDWLQARLHICLSAGKRTINVFT